MVPADAESCESFEKLAKCKHCRHYLPGAEAHLGLCQAETTEAMTYPDLTAVTCEWFAWTST